MVSSQVSVLCLPHGQLLREMRRRNASVFNRVHGLYRYCDRQYFILIQEP